MTVTTEVGRSGGPRRRVTLIRRGLINVIGDPMALTVLRGPSGSGKTDLVEQWALSDWATPFTVVRVPEARWGQQEADLWSAVGAALRIALAAGPGIVPAAADDFDSVAELLAGGHGEIVLVLEHPDRVAAAGLENRITTLLLRLEHVRIVLCVGTDRLFPRPAALDLGLDYQLIGPEDLRLTPAETREMAAQAGVDLSAEALAALHLELGGMPLQTSAAVPALWRFAELDTDPDGAWQALARAMRELVDRVLPSRPNLTAAREIAILAAVHGSVTEPMLNAIIGPEALADGGALTERLGVLFDPAHAPGRDGSWFLTPAIRRVVLERLAGCGTPEVHGLIARLAEYLVSVGDAAGALRCGLQTGDWIPFWPVLKDNWARLIATDIQLVREVLIQLPADLAAQDESVNIGRAMFMSLDSGVSDVVAGTSHDNAEFLTPDGLPLPLSVVVPAGTVRSIIFRLAGEFADSSAIALKVADLYDAATESERREVADHLPVMRLQWGVNHQLADELERSDVQLRLAHVGGALMGIDYCQKNAAGSLALNAALRGEITQAADWLEVEAGFGDSPSWLGPRVRVSGQVARVIVELGRLDLDAARDALEELGEPDDIEELWAPMILAQGRVAHLAGDPELGLDRVRRATAKYPRWSQPGSFAARSLGVLSAQLQTAMGRGNAALAALADCPPDHPSVRTCRARVLLLSGDAPAALVELWGMPVDRWTWAEKNMEALLLSAVAHAELGDSASSAETLRRALALAEISGTRQPLLSLPRLKRHALVDAGLVCPELREIWARHDHVEMYPAVVAVVTLSPREVEVVTRLAGGTSLQAIADELFVSPNTVKTQLKSIYRKLQVNNRDEAVQVAHRLYLV